MRRLIVAQGPTQLLNAISILKYQLTTQEYSNCEDVLLLGNFFTEQDEISTQGIVDACLQVAQIWQFKLITFFKEIECCFYSGQLSFEAVIQQLRTKLGIDRFDVVYTSRNWQLINEASLNAYSHARKICYGDTLGITDLDSPAGIQGAINPNGLVHMDATYLVQPGMELVEGIWNKVPTQFIDFSFFQAAVYESADQILGLKNYCKTLRNLGDNLVFVLLANCTESKTTQDVNSEINLYLSCILPYISPGEVLLVKRHPRQTLDQSTKLVEALSQHHPNVQEISEFTQISIELFAPFIPLKKAFTLISSSCISLAYLSQIELIVGFGDKNVRRYTNPSLVDTLNFYQKAYALLIQQAYKRQLQPLHFPDRDRLLSETLPFPVPVRLTPAFSIPDPKPVHPNAHELLLTIDLQQTNLELMTLREYTQTLESKAQMFEAEIESWRSQVQQVQSAWSQTQAELAQVKTQFEQAQLLWQGQSQALQTHIAHQKNRIEQDQGKLRGLNQEVRSLQAILTGIKTSKFWKMRRIWVKLKRSLVRLFRNP